MQAKNIINYISVKGINMTYMHQKLNVEINDFYFFFVKNRFIVILIIVSCMGIGFVKSMMSSLSGWTASVKVYTPTNQAISSLNFNKNYSTRISPLNYIEVFVIFSKIAVTDSVQKEFLEDHQDSKTTLTAIEGPGYKLLLRVFADNPVKAKALLKSYLNKTSQLALDKSNQLLKKMTEVMRTKVEKEISSYKLLYAEYDAKSQMAVRSKLYGSNQTLEKEALDNQKIARQYQALIDKGLMELVSMHHTPVKLHEVDFFQMEHQIEVHKNNPWPTRLKIFFMHTVLGVLISIMLMLLLFMYQNHRLSS